MYMSVGVSKQEQRKLHLYEQGRCVSPVAAELQSVPVVEWSSAEWSCSLAVAAAAAGGQMTERVGVSSLAGWESIRIERIKM